MNDQKRTENPKDRQSKSGAPSKRSIWPVVLHFLPAALVLVLIVGILTAVAIFGYRVLSSDGGTAASGDHQAASSVKWTCSMHPQFKLPSPGLCPICMMDLIPLEEEQGGPRTLSLTEEAARLAEIRTSLVRRQYATKEIRMVGKVEVDETRIANITAWVPGRLDRLFVDYTGITVRKGDHLVELYSPDLIVAQRELLQAIKSAERLGQVDTRLAESTLRSAEEKLRLLGLLPDQIAELKRRGEPTDHITIYSPIGGIVLSKDAVEGKYVQTGTKIYTIADLSVIWVMLEAYETDLPWLRYGQRVEFTTEAYPGEIFAGRIAFIDPVLDDRTRTVHVRVNVKNDDGRLKPGMFVRANVRSHIAQGGRVFDPSLIGKWISPMHPEIIKDEPGQCDICGMDLVRAEDLGYQVPEAALKTPLVIPATAPLITGRRAVVYVQLPGHEKPTFEGREVLLGDRAGDMYIVRHGLTEGERVVTHGNFKLDSALQIQAKPSMMSQPGEGTISEDDLHDEPTDEDELIVPPAFRGSIDPIYQNYFAAREALALDDMNSARAKLADLASIAKSLASTTLDETAAAQWKTLADRIIFAALEASESTDRDTLRRHFAVLSTAMSRIVRSFGQATDGPFYRYRCPMAVDARGGTWLQRTDAPTNPYFGRAMPDCAELIETFRSKAPLPAPLEFRTQMGKLYNAYLAIQVPLADDRLDDARVAQASYNRVFAETSAMAAKLLTGRSLKKWQELAAQIEPAIADDPQTLAIEPLRERFEPISMAMLAAATDFGHISSANLYRAYCPMAFGNRGAAWLQADDTVANPYFGHTMLRCGVIQQEFPPIEQKDNESTSDDTEVDDE